MAVPSTEIQIAYATDGVSTTFSYPNYLRDPSDLIVTAVDGAQDITSYIYNSDYTFSGTPFAPGDGSNVYRSGGNIIFGTPPPAGLTLLITRRTPNTQATSFISSDKLPAKVLETSMDLIVLRDQEIGRHFQGYADGFPSAGGPYQVDDWFFIRNAGNFGYKEIICVTAGSPGIWKPLNPIGA
ncbi:MAG: hypothetical protein WAU89_23325 [Candidatus Acidiferrales bacterium]